MEELDGDIKVQQEIERVLGEFTELAYDGKIKAIAFVIVNDEDSLMTRIAFKRNNKIPLVAGTAVLHSTALEHMTPSNTFKLSGD